MWCELGLDHAEFGRLTLREYEQITRARIEAKNQEFKAQRVINQELGTLIQFAFHDPKKMPDFTKAQGAAGSARQSKEQDMMRLHQFFLGQSLKQK